MSIITIQANVVSDTNCFINFWHRSLATQGERQFKEVYVNHTTLTTPPHARRILWYLRSQLTSTGRDSNWSNLIKCKKTKLNRYFQRLNLNSTIFSKSSNSKYHYFRAWCQPPTQCSPTAVRAHFLTVSLLWQIMIVISFLHGRAGALSYDNTWTRDTE